MRTTGWTLAVLLACAGIAAGGFEADVTITNTTGEDKANWPVFLTVYKVFGGNLPIERINPTGFHVSDAAGVEGRQLAAPRECDGALAAGGTDGAGLRGPLPREVQP